MIVRRARMRGARARPAACHLRPSPAANGRELGVSRVCGRGMRRAWQVAWLSASMGGQIRASRRGSVGIISPVAACWPDRSVGSSARPSVVGARHRSPWASIFSGASPTAGLCVSEFSVAP